MPNLTPVTVVTGFLGAGKTTLVNAWLGEYACGDVAVIVNEYGEIGIDGELLRERTREIIEITGGCVCCTTNEELVSALETLSRGDAKRILVETSGAASPAGVLRAVLSGGRSDSFSLDGVVALLDAGHLGEVLSQDLAIEQLGCADVVVLSHADVCSSAALERAREVVVHHNEAAVVVASENGRVRLETLLEMRDADIVPAQAKHSHAQTYESVSLFLEGEVDGDRFAEFVESEIGKYAGRIFRIKGILAVAGSDARMIVHGVFDRLSVTFGAAWRSDRMSRLVIVGYGLDRAAISAGFDLCASSQGTGLSK